MSRLHLTRLAASLVLAALSLGARAGSPVWLTLDEPALALLRQQQPSVASQGQARLPVMAPSRDGASLVPAFDTVHIVRTDSDALPALSDAVHASLHHCGGYKVHSSLAEARQALARDQRQAQLAQRQALAKAAIPINNQAQVQPLITQVQDSHILSTMQTLSDFQNRYYTTSHGVAASDALLAQWQALAAGRSDVTVSQFSHAGWPQKSVILSIQGSTTPKHLVVLGAHMDSILSGGTNETSRAPGADDDASGVASLTEVIRVLLSSGYQPKRTLQFMAYAAEEVGLRGSAAIAADYAAKGRKVDAVLQLDMTDYQGSAQDIFLFTDYTAPLLNDFLAGLASTYLPSLTVARDRCGYACSDHASWTNRGYQAAFPFESAMSSHDPYIHTVNDTLAKLGNQAAHAAKFSKLALAFAVELASD
jgi:leucyl aminopeptidase